MQVTTVEALNAVIVQNLVCAVVHADQKSGWYTLT